MAAAWKKSYDQPRQHIKKQTLPTKVHLVKAMVFPVVLYGCESWTMKKAECPRIDAFELWGWRRLLRGPWTAKRSNKSILRKSVLNIHWKDWCWSWNSNTLANQCKKLTQWKKPWCWERLKAEGEGNDRGWHGWMASPTQWTWVWVGSGSWWWTGRPGVLQSMGLQRVRHDWATELNWYIYSLIALKCCVSFCWCNKVNHYMCTCISSLLYVESRKIVQMNLVPGQEWRCKHENTGWGAGGQEAERGK